MGGPSAVVALLRDLAEGVEFRQAFERRFAMSYEHFEEVVTR